jgi:hypothetical protein
VAQSCGSGTPSSKASPFGDGELFDDEKGLVHSNAKLDGVSRSFYQPLVLIVRTDPEPNHFITFDRAEGTVVSCDPRRMNVPLGLDFLEPEPGVTWILPKTSIRLPSLFLYLRGQITKGLTKAPSS